MDIRQNFMWIAFLDDDSIVTEFNPDGTENSYPQLPKSKVTHFGLQSAHASYVFDLKDGALHSKKNGLTKKTNIAIPFAKKKYLPIDGPLNGDSRYAFTQYKEAYSDFNAVSLQQYGSSITHFNLAIFANKMINGLGIRYVKIALRIENILNPNPILSVTLSTLENGPAMDGSPYVITL